MTKTTALYWNPLHAVHKDKWSVIEGTNGLIEQLFLAVDQKTGDFTRLTRFKAGADTSEWGPQVHDYPEEIFIVSGRLYDQAFDHWLEAGEYASRPAGEVHGPFVAQTDCIVLDCAYPSQTVASETSADRERQY